MRDDLLSTLKVRQIESFNGFGVFPLPSVDPRLLAHGVGLGCDP